MAFPVIKKIRFFLLIFSLGHLQHSGVRYRGRQPGHVYVFGRLDFRSDQTPPAAEQSPANIRCKLQFVSKIPPIIFFLTTSCIL